MILLFTIIYFKGKDTEGKKYNLITLWRGLKYKKCWIMLIIIIVFINDLIKSKIYPLNSTYMGLILLLVIILTFIFSCFSNKLIDDTSGTDDSKQNVLRKILNVLSINTYKVSELEKNKLQKITNEEMIELNKSKTLTCNAEFDQTTIINPPYDFTKYNLETYLYIGALNLLQLL